MRCRAVAPTASGGRPSAFVTVSFVVNVLAGWPGVGSITSAQRRSTSASTTFGSGVDDGAISGAAAAAARPASRSEKATATCSAVTRKRVIIIGYAS